MWRKLFLFLIIVIVTSLWVGLAVIFVTKEKNNNYTDNADFINAEDLLKEESFKVEPMPIEEKKQENKKKDPIKFNDLPDGIQEAMNNKKEENKQKQELEEKRDKLLFSSLNSQSISLLVSYLDKRVIFIKKWNIIVSVVFNDTENMNLPIDARNGFKEKIKMTNIYNNADYATFLSSFLKERTEEIVSSNYLINDLGLKSNKKTPIVWDLPYTYEFSHLMYIPELYNVTEESYTKNILEYFVKAYEHSIENKEQKNKRLKGNEQIIANQKATIPFLLNIKPKGVKFFNDLYFDILENKNNYKIYEMHIDSNNFWYLYLFKKILYGDENFKNTLAFNLKENYSGAILERMSIYDNPNYYEIKSFNPTTAKEIYKEENAIKDIQKVNKNIINMIIKIKNTNE